jgi:hypothetical protein
MTLLLKDDARLLDLARESAGETVTDPQIEYETEGIRTLVLSERVREKVAASEFSMLADTPSSPRR